MSFRRRFTMREFNPRIETQAARVMALNWAIDGTVTLPLTDQPDQPSAQCIIHFGGFLAPSGEHSPAWWVALQKVISLLPYGNWRCMLSQRTGRDLGS
jgi:hypothetical protein